MGRKRQLQALHRRLLEHLADHGGRCRRIGTVSLSRKVGDQAVTIRASFVDASGAADTLGKVAFAVDNATVLGLTDNGDGSAAISFLAAGDANVTATDTDPDGNAVTTPAFAVTVVDASHDAVSGSISVESDPNAAPAAPAAPEAPAAAPAADPSATPPPA